MGSRQAGDGDVHVTAQQRKQEQYEQVTSANAHALKNILENAYLDQHEHQSQ
jgi:hypothetical protein